MDQETGLYYCRARYYDSSTGRFLSEDPIGFNSGDFNSYRYVLNNPLILSDPKGKAANYILPILIGGIIGGIIYFWPEEDTKPYNPDTYPKVEPPHPNPDNTDSLEEKLQKERENDMFKNKLC